MPGTIYKLCPRALWLEAQAAGVFRGAPVDRKDGFIHFSTFRQVEETAAKHFAGVEDVLLLSVSAGRLGAALRYEPSRGGDLFPHLYGELPLAAVTAVAPLARDDSGRLVFPALAGEA